MDDIDVGLTRIRAVVKLEPEAVSSQELLPLLRYALRCIDQHAQQDSGIESARKRLAALKVEQRQAEAHLDALFRRAQVTGSVSAALTFLSRAQAALTPLVGAPARCEDVPVYSLDDLDDLEPEDALGSVEA